jgi:hypothetical protein
MESIDQCAILDGRATFLRAPADADISVSERQHGFDLGEEFRVKRFFDDVPLSGWMMLGGDLRRS